MTEGLEPAAVAGRHATGVPGLDLILGGGLVRGSLYMVVGQPGTGKTTLANQACFAHAARGGRAAYVTLLAETHARMLANLEPMSFFDPAPVGGAIAYVGAYGALRTQGLPGLLQLLRRVMRDQRATLLVVDGLAQAGGGAADAREFLVELQTLGAMSGCTTLLLSGATAEDVAAPEYAMVDGLIALYLTRAKQRTLRELEVPKFRGGDHVLGRHEMEITAGGVVVRPRTEEILARGEIEAAIAPSEGRRATGVRGLDAMLGGGLLSGTVTMLLGFAGSGKTMLCAHFLADGASRGEPGLYFGFYEAPERLAQGADRIGLRFGEHVRAGAIDVLWQPPLRHSLDALAERLLENVRRRKVRRVVIDGLDGFRQTSAYPERTIRFVTSLANALRAMDVTMVITEETQKLFGPEVEVRVAGMSALVDNILLLEYLDVGSELKRLLSIVKQRASGYEARVRELCITDAGLVLADTAESASGILSGGAELGSKRNRRPAAAPGGAKTAKKKVTRTKPAGANASRRGGRAR